MSILTACGWVDGECNSFAVISDYASPDKYFTMVALLNILGQLIAKYPEVSVASLFSDGAAQHFKNKDTLSGVS